MTESWRCFVAAPIPDRLRGRLQDARTAWRARPELGSLRWTDPARWHLTLLFLGEVEAARVPAIVDAVREVAGRHRPVELTTGGLGGFPSPARARVAWYAIADHDGRLAALARDLAASVAVRMADGGPYRPHLTLARARREPVDLRGWVRDAGSEVRDSMRVERIELLRSRPDRPGAPYETVAGMPLRGQGA